MHIEIMTGEKIHFFRRITLYSSSPSTCHTANVLFLLVTMFHFGVPKSSTLGPILFSFYMLQMIILTIFLHVPLLSFNLHDSAHISPITTHTHTQKPTCRAHTQALKAHTVTETAFLLLSYRDSVSVKKNKQEILSQYCLKVTIKWVLCILPGNKVHHCILRCYQL